MKKLILPILGVMASLFVISCSHEKVVMHENQWYNPGSVLTSTAPINKAPTIKCQESAVPAMVQEGISLNQPIVTATAFQNVNTTSNILKPIVSISNRVVAEQMAKQHQAAPKMVKKANGKKTLAAKPMSDIPFWFAIVICFFFPAMAVSIATDGDNKTILINLLWSLLFGVPGIIHGIIVVCRNRDMFR